MFTQECNNEQKILNENFKNFINFEKYFYPKIIKNSKQKFIPKGFLVCHG